MPNRTAKFVSAIFASILAGIPLRNGIARRRRRGRRLPFRTERPGARWQPLVLSHRSRHQASLLVPRRTGRKASQSARANSSPSAKPISPTAGGATQRSIADAHAELPAQTHVDSAQARRRVPVAASRADARRGRKRHSAARLRWTASGSVIASRWPDPRQAQFVNASPRRHDPDATPICSPCCDRRSPRGLRRRCSGCPRPKTVRIRSRCCCSSFSAHWRSPVLIGSVGFQVRKPATGSAGSKFALDRQAHLGNRRRDRRSPSG